jgi:hypothetical protein
MGLLFTEFCSGCGVSDDREPLVKVTGTIYRLGTAHGINAKVCPECYIKIKQGKSKNFSLR